MLHNNINLSHGKALTALQISLTKYLLPLAKINNSDFLNVDFPVQIFAQDTENKKNSHQVSKCKQESYGKCKFESKYCWFIHESDGNVLSNEKNNEVIKEQSDVMQKVFGMLETMTERIMKIEQNNTNKTI